MVEATIEQLVKLNLNDNANGPEGHKQAENPNPKQMPVCDFSDESEEESDDFDAIQQPAYQKAGPPDQT